jgi:hypothetical protein
MGPVIELLETRVPQMGSYFWYNNNILNFLENPIAPALRAFRQIFTLEIFSTPEPHLETPIRLIQLDPRGYLAQTFLTTLGRTIGDLAQKIDVEFRLGELLAGRTVMPVIDEPVAHPIEVLRFRGSILEFTAHLPPDRFSQVEHGQALHEILDLAAGHFDPSTVMLLAMGHHKHVNPDTGPGPPWRTENSPGTRCWGCLVLKKLLRLGAKSTVPGFAIGSLQIAASFANFAAMTLLLEAGVDPNDVGDLRGDIGTPETGPMLEWLQCLRGRSPLNILNGQRFAALRQGVIGEFVVRNPASSPYLGKHEALLMQYGAKDFVISLDEQLPIATQMGGISISEREMGVV